MEKLHERLRAELEAKGLSAAQAARDAGEPDSQGLRDVLSGRKRLSAELLAALVNGTGIDGAYVLSGKTQQQRIEEAAAGMPERLRALREERGIEAVLKVSGLTAKQWQKAEESTGPITFPQGTLQRLIEGFNLDPMQFLTGQAETITTNRTDETLLVKNYRACTPADQETIRHQAAFLAARGKSGPIPAGESYPQRVDAPPLVLHDKPRKKGA